MCNLFEYQFFVVPKSCVYAEKKFQFLFSFFSSVIVSPNYDSLFKLSFCFAVLERENQNFFAHALRTHTHSRFLGCRFLLFLLLFLCCPYLCAEWIKFRMNKSIWHNTLHFAFAFLHLFLFFFFPFRRFSSRSNSIHTREDGTKRRNKKTQTVNIIMNPQLSKFNKPFPNE